MSTLLARTVPISTALRTFEPLPAADIRSPIDALLTVPASYVDATTLIDDLATAQARLDQHHPMVLCALVISGVAGFDSNNRAVAESNLFSRRTVRLDIECRDARGRPCVMKVYGGIWGWRGVHIGATERLLIKSIDWTRDRPQLSRRDKRWLQAGRC